MVNPLDDFLVRQNKGFYCKYGDFYIDPLDPVEVAIISHAHADHARAGHAKIYATKPTVAFMQIRYPRQGLKTYDVIDYYETFYIKDIAVTFIPAGHMLGSAQILMEYKNVRYLYTGDFKLQEDHTCESIDIVQANVLITETTFAHPDIKHPDPVSEIKKLNDTNSNILLGCYALGKAQRLTDLIHRYCPEKEVLVHHNMVPLHKIYDSMNKHKLVYTPYNRQAMKIPNQHKVYLVPPFTFSSYIRAKNVIRAFASGWKKLQRQNGIELLISDHVDWYDLLHFIQLVAPQEIWTIHGEGSYLESHFSNTIKVKRLN